MQRARAFFFVCAGLLCLAIAYNLGATRSAASPQSVIVDAGHPYYCGNGNCCTLAVLGRTLYIDGQPSSSPIPGTARVAWVGTGTYNNPSVMLENGDTYWEATPGGPWGFVRNAVGGVTPVAQSTWGQVKAKYAK